MEAVLPLRVSPSRCAMLISHQSHTIPWNYGVWEFGSEVILVCIWKCFWLSRGGAGGTKGQPSVSVSAILCRGGEPSVSVTAILCRGGEPSLSVSAILWRGREPSVSVMTILCRGEGNGKPCFSSASSFRKQLMSVPLGTWVSFCACSRPLLQDDLRKKKTGICVVSEPLQFREDKNFRGSVCSCGCHPMDFTACLN